MATAIYRPMMNYFRRHPHVPLLGILLVLFTFISLGSVGYFGGADNISHYLISHFSFRYPSLFLNSWGRPLYTLISAPFAFFGLQGAKLLNVFLGISTGYLAYRIAQIFRLKPALIVLIFVCFSPLYFVMMPTALTEILFSFILLLSIFLFLKGKHVASAIVISFIPFARTEGYVLLPAFLLALLWARQPGAIPFLATGIVAFSIAGSFHFGDILWVFNQFPYPVTYQHPIYHSTGSLWHFIQQRDVILGLPLEILFVAGIAGMTRDLLSKDDRLKQTAQQLAFLVLFPFLVYLALHSVLYWRALGGSMGLERVLAAVLPLAALVCAKGFSDLAQLLRSSRVLYTSFTIMVVGVVVFVSFRTYQVPTPLSPEEKTIRRAVAWLKSSPYAGRLCFYTDNNVPYYSKADPYRKNPAECVLFGDSKYLDTIPPGSVMIWDAHFGTNEAKIPVDSLLGNRHQKVLNYFRPDEPWITFGGGWYDCYITLTMNPGEVADNYAIRDSIREVLDAKDVYKTLYQNTFENQDDVYAPALLSTDTVHRGNKAYRMDQRTEYSPGICLPVSGLPLQGDQAKLMVSLYVNMPQIIDGLNTLLVISFEHLNKPYIYTPVSLNDLKFRPGTWNRVSLQAVIPKFITQEDLLKVYIWNPGKQVFYLDDLRVDLIN